ncbi:MAG: prolipoprotein diacylglyceryl transferase [Ruminococcaceae bacterium]|nr:prolipoprotein diacylglyceryl transferase [Oscillospiraceae bacterium]
MNQIGFPGLGLTFEIDRVAFDVFGKEIYWYAIIIACGFLLAVSYGMRRAHEFSLKQDDLLDMLLFAVPIAILSARAYYVIFNFSEYRHDLIRVLYIWEGGIAIYGAIIGSLITVIMFCRKRKLPLGDMVDIGALGLLIGQSIGRWGNFVNAEAFGGPTTLPWRMRLYDRVSRAMVEVHPTFLYESLWNLLGFILLHFYSKKRMFSGEIFFLYVAWYGLGRAFIEGLRTDSLYLFGSGIRISQMVGIVSFVAASVVLVVKSIQRKKQTEV